MSKSKSTQTRVNTPHTGAGAAFAAACKGKLPRIRLDAAWLARFKRRFAEAHIAARLANDEIRAAGFTWPDDELTTEDWEYLARVVEEREPGKLTAREIHQIALAWVERERMKHRIRVDVESAGSPATIQRDCWTLAEAADQLDIPRPALTKAARTPPDDPRHLQTHQFGRNRFVRRDHARAFAKNYSARREARQLREL